MLAVAQVVATPHEQSMPRSLAYEMVDGEATLSDLLLPAHEKDREYAGAGSPHESRGVRATPESSR